MYFFTIEKPHCCSFRPCSNSFFFHYFSWGSICMHTHQEQYLVSIYLWSSCQLRLTCLIVTMRTRVQVLVLCSASVRPTESQKTSKLCNHCCWNARKQLGKLLFSLWKYCCLPMFAVVFLVDSWRECPVFYFCLCNNDDTSTNDVTGVSIKCSCERFVLKTLHNKVLGRLCNG